MSQGIRRKPNLQHAFGDIWYDQGSYAGFIYKKQGDKYLLIATTGSTVEGSKAYDDKHRVEKQ